MNYVLTFQQHHMFNENANKEYYYTHLCCDHVTLFLL